MPGLWLSEARNADLTVPASDHCIFACVSMPVWASSGMGHRVVSALLGLLAHAGIAESMAAIAEFGVRRPRMTVGAVQPHRSVLLQPPLQLSMFGPVARRLFPASYDGGNWIG